MKALTQQQRRALVMMSNAAEFTPVALANLLETSKEGAAMTAASLIRRGLAQRTGARPALYRITSAGMAHVRAEQLELIP